jgi:hypothetical protein
MSQVKINLSVFNKNRIECSSGCIRTNEINGVKCLDNTFVQREDWKKINLLEFLKLKGTNTFSLNKVSLIKLPRNISQKLKLTQINNSIHLSEIRAIEESSSFKEVISEIEIFLKKFQAEYSHLVKHPIYFGKPKLLNNTFDPENNVFIGLHLDSWEKQNLINRVNSRNRICINLGSSPRYLIFYSISIEEMAKRLNYSLNQKIDIRNVYATYASKFPSERIYKIKINPFEAYCAPTEYVIHDGRSENSVYPDINIVFRGYFQIPFIF